MLELLQMWAMLEVLGIVFLPLTITVFRNLPDRGWAFSKTIGLAVLAFCVWLPLMVLQMLPFSQPLILGVLLILVALNVLGFLRVRKALLELVRTHLFYIICVELIFFGMVFLLGWLRSYSPDIRNYEMFMDEGFLSAIMRSAHFPPNDMWYAGQPINYYYYAHYTIAMLAKLLGQSPSVAFNTGISIFFGLTAANLFGVTCNVVAWARHRRRLSLKNPSNTNPRPDRVLPSMNGAIPYGILTILLGEVLGNLATTQAWWQNHGSLPDLYWFNASRVIINTINEFPAFSFLLSCFHAHVLALAFTILGIGLAFNLLLERNGQGFAAFGRGWRLPLNLGVTALSIGGLFAMNGWDYPTYLALVLVCLIFQQWHAHDGRLSLDLLLDVLTSGVALGALSFLLFAPFYMNFVSPAQGLGIVGPNDRSPLAGEILIYGIPAFILISFLLVNFLRERLTEAAVVVASSPSLGSSIEPALVASGGVGSQPQRAYAPATPVLQEEPGAQRPMAVDTLDETSNQEESDIVDVQIEDLEPEQERDQEQSPFSAPSSATSATSGWGWSDIRLIGLLIALLASPLILLLLKNSVTFVIMGSLALISFVLVLYHLRERERSFVLLLGAVACALVA
ncbi:MAG TPA: DUF2298 domain-containing protein, partial [Ktedonobacteraceae bacterium]|nr:DUF2298 domain-containing protein [Ktedonobacteraceae bacterium]